MQTPKEDVVETWHHYRVAFSLRVVARDPEAAKAAFTAYYFGGNYEGGVQEEEGFSVVELDGQWRPIDIPLDAFLEARYEEGVSDP